MKSNFRLNALMMSLICMSIISLKAQTTEKYELVWTYVEIAVGPTNGKYRRGLVLKSLRHGYVPLRDDLDMKMLECNSLNPTYLRGIIVNKGASPFIGKIRIKVYDEDYDIVWQGLEDIKVDAKNGTKYSTRIGVGTCLKPHMIVMDLDKQEN